MKLLILNFESHSNIDQLIFHRDRSSIYVNYDTLHIIGTVSDDICDHFIILKNLRIL